MPGFVSVIKKYGRVPKSYELDGEKFYIGSELGNYLKFHRDALYKQYPLLPKRIATALEKKQLEKEGVAKSLLRANVVLIPFVDIQDIFKGNDKKFRVNPSAIEYNAADSTISSRPSVTAVHSQVRNSKIYVFVNFIIF